MNTGLPEDQRAAQPLTDSLSNGRKAPANAASVLEMARDFIRALNPYKEPAARSRISYWIRHRSWRWKSHYWSVYPNLYDNSYVRTYPHFEHDDDNFSLQYNGWPTSFGHALLRLYTASALRPSSLTIYRLNALAVCTLLWIRSRLGGFGLLTAALLAWADRPKLARHEPELAMIKQLAILRSAVSGGFPGGNPKFLHTDNLIISYPPDLPPDLLAEYHRCRFDAFIMRGDYLAAFWALSRSQDPGDNGQSTPLSAKLYLLHKAALANNLEDSEAALDFLSLAESIGLSTPLLRGRSALARRAAIANGGVLGVGDSTPSTWRIISLSLLAGDWPTIVAALDMAGRTGQGRSASRRLSSTVLLICLGMAMGNVGLRARGVRAIIARYPSLLENEKFGKTLRVLASSDENGLQLIDLAEHLLRSQKSLALDVDFVVSCACQLEYKLNGSAEPRVRAATFRQLSRFLAAALPVLARCNELEAAFFLAELGRSSILQSALEGQEFRSTYRKIARATTQPDARSSFSDVSFHRITKVEESLASAFDLYILSGQVRAPKAVDRRIYYLIPGDCNLLTLDIIDADDGQHELVRLWRVSGEGGGSDIVELSKLDMQLIQFWRAMDLVDRIGSLSRMRHLGNLLLPLEFQEQLLASPGRAVIVRPDARTWSMPFAALGLNGTTLCNVAALTITPSVSAHISLSPNQIVGRKVRAGFDPSLSTQAEQDALTVTFGGWAPLGGSVDAEEEALQSFLDTEAEECSRGVRRTAFPFRWAPEGVPHVTESRSPDGVLYVAGHGIADGDSSSIDAIQVGVGYNVTLNDTEVGILTVLGACSSASVRSGGGELFGLSIDSLFRGASAVLAAVSAIDDEHASSVLGEVILGLGKGSSLAAALREVQSQRAVRWADDPAALGLSWAAIQVIGDGDIRLEAS